MIEITLTSLRKDLFRTVDQVLETGEPVVIHRKGRRLVLREEAGDEVSPAVQARRQRYLDLPPRVDEPDLSFEDIEQALAEAKTWDQEPEIDG